MPDQDFKLLITGDASSAVDAAQQTGDALQKLKGETAGLNDETKDTTDAVADMGASSESTGEKVEEAGKKAGESGEKHRALRRIMGELNRISPGLGEVLELLSSSYRAAGEAAEGGAVGVQEFNVALKEVLVSLGPLVIAMLAVEAVMEYWDMYKEKVKGAAEAQEEATKRIVESTKSALEAVRELDEAMHPKEQGVAEKDEANLKKNLHDLDNAYARQKELNRAEEEKEVAAAGSPAEKEAIKKKFEALDAQLNEWREKQKAAVESAMVGTMQKQLDELKAAEPDLIKKLAAQYRLGIETGNMGRYNQTRDILKKNAEEAKSIRGKMDEVSEQKETDAGDAEFREETNRQVFETKGEKYQAPKAGFDMPTPDAAANDAAGKFATGKSIADTALGGGNVDSASQQFLVVLEQSITGQKLTFEQAVRLIEMQSKNHDFVSTLLERNIQKIEAVTSRLSTLESRIRGIPGMSK